MDDGYRCMQCVQLALFLCMIGVRMVILDKEIPQNPPVWRIPELSKTNQMRISGAELMSMRYIDAWCFDILQTMNMEVCFTRLWRLQM